MNNSITLDERIEAARALRKQGYNCSQCVFMVFNDVHGLSPEDAFRIIGGLGGGVGGQHHVCGTVSAMSTVLSSVYYDVPAKKIAAYGAIKDCCGRFSDMNGSVICAELLADTPRRKPCMAYIEDSITILHKYLTECGGC